MRAQIYLLSFVLAFALCGLCYELYLTYLKPPKWDSSSDSSIERFRKSLRR